ncbi:MFS transporter [Nonomuraea endophytica]|uniref:MFS family permease n=1 Tax=Nonomuraea endophytica TaxID=714136 RepID=A0A7W8EKP6_9ACTN|nr:MFS transporter [Nonomuraea endophytica]MBB5084490.1 MFS family permease [Nonomuraea endophytica]
MTVLAPVRAVTARPLAAAAVVLLGFLVVPMSISGTAVALPRIGADLTATGAPLQWVMNAYNLTFASFMLVAGSLADLYGRRRVFATGAAVFAAGSLAAGIAQNVWLLDAARALSGVGAAAVMAGGAALLATLFEGPARTRAFAALGVVAGAGLALGPSAAGWLVGGLGWRAFFLANAVVLGLSLLGSVFVAESRAGRRVPVDVPGALTSIGGLALLTVAVVQGPQAGWGSVQVLGLVAAAAALLVAFVVLQRRSAHPILDLTLVRNRAFLALSLVPVAITFGFVTLLTYLPTYLVGANGLGVREAGTWMLALTAPVLVVPPVGGWLVNRGVPAGVLVPGSVLMFAIGAAWLTVLHPGAGLGELAGPLLLVGAGVGIAFGVGDGLAMSMVEPERAGMAAGFVNTMRIGSEAVVIAVFGAALVSLVGAEVGDGALANRIAAGEGTAPEAFTAAWHLLLWAIAVICTVAAVGIHTMLRRK